MKGLYNWAAPGDWWPGRSEGEDMWSSSRPFFVEAFIMVVIRNIFIMHYTVVMAFGSTGGHMSVWVSLLSFVDRCIPEACSLGTTSWLRRIHLPPYGPLYIGKGWPLSKNLLVAEINEGLGVLFCPLSLATELLCIILPFLFRWKTLFLLCVCVCEREERRVRERKRVCVWERDRQK